MILVLCERGNVRSATAAIILRDCYGFLDVIPTGVSTTTEPLLHELCHEADTIFIVGDDTVKDRFLSIFSEFVFVHIDIGLDVWGRPMDYSLVERLVNWFEANLEYKSYPFYGSAENYLRVVNRT